MHTDPIEDSEDNHMSRWTMTTADDQVVSTFRGDRAGAVADANQRGEQLGERVYTEREGTRFVVPADGSHPGRPS